MATYDKEWGPTCRFARKEYGPGVLIGEFPLYTDGGKARRRVDGILIRGGSQFEAHQWFDLDEHARQHWASESHGSKLAVVQTKVAAVGLAVLGQALLSHLLIEERFSPVVLETVALGASVDEELLAVLEDDRFSGLRIAADDSLHFKSTKVRTHERTGSTPPLCRPRTSRVGMRGEVCVSPVSRGRGSVCRGEARATGTVGPVGPERRPPALCEKASSRSPRARDLRCGARSSRRPCHCFVARRRRGRRSRLDRPSLSFSGG